MQILVTGGAGFVGTNLIKQLLKDGHTVYSLDNYTTGKQENHVDGCIYYTNDIQNISAYDDRFMTVDVVYHMAAIARIQPSFERPIDYIATNFNGTYEVVKYCIKNDIPLIYAGSSSHHSGKFKNPYTFSKDLGEEIIKLYQEHFGLKSSIARFYNVYGPYQLTEGGYTTLIGRWMNNIENKLPCEIYGNGEKKRDFTHVDDIVEGLIRIMLWKEYGEIFEFGRGKNYSVNEVADMFGIDVVYKDNKPGEAEETLADYSLAKYKLGWEPKKELKDYIKGNYEK
ncbi:MAG: NAD-dependent epimerase/dehydratase family protein [Pelagibacterales bacterium]|nr:NAD-dependent epimerase/dehydratase family protein [Pelagibacterales bacterium]